MEFNRQRIVERHTTATEVITESLPTRPLSHLIITLAALNATDEATLAEMIAFINNVQVTHHGVGIVDVQSEDLYGVNAYLFRGLPTLTGRLATDNYSRALTLVVPFGRRIFDAAECYPGTKKGELVLRVDTTVPATSCDGSVISIDAVELPEASPTKFLKTLRKALSAPGATGEREYELPTGNEYVCCQFRLTTVPAASSYAFGVDIAKLLVNNKEYGYTGADMLCMTGERFLRVGNPDATIAAQGLSPLNAIAWMDFDPLGDGNFLVDTSGVESAKLNLNMGVDEALNLTTMELVKV